VVVDRNERFRVCENESFHDFTRVDATGVEKADSDGLDSERVVCRIEGKGEKSFAVPSSCFMVNELVDVGRGPYRAIVRRLRLAHEGDGDIERGKRVLARAVLLGAR
jgi:hypothetical protein